MHASDQERFAWISANLYVPVVCDVLDALGRRHQAMSHRLRPLDERNCVIVGRARTFRWMEVDHVIEEDPYGLEIEAMDSLRLATWPCIRRITAPPTRPGASS